MLQASASGRAAGVSIAERAGDSREAAAAQQLIARLAAPADDVMDVDEDSVAAPAPADPEADIFAAAPEAASVPNSAPDVERTDATAAQPEATANENGQRESIRGLPHPSPVQQQETQVPAAVASRESEAEAATAGTSPQPGATQNGQPARFVCLIRFLPFRLVVRGCTFCQ